MQSETPFPPVGAAHTVPTFPQLDSSSERLRHVLPLRVKPVLQPLIPQTPFLQVGWVAPGTVGQTIPVGPQLVGSLLTVLWQTWFRQMRLAAQLLSSPGP